MMAYAKIRELSLEFPSLSFFVSLYVLVAHLGKAVLMSTFLQSL